jgi:hypothetical protein
MKAKPNPLDSAPEEVIERMAALMASWVRRDAAKADAERNEASR